jgi:beta-D-xylosidase 4
MPEASRAWPLAQLMLLAVLPVLLLLDSTIAGEVGLSSRTQGHPVPNPSGPYLRNPCLGDTKYSKLPFCDPRLSLDTRAADIVSRLSQVEQITALGSQDAGLPSVGLPPYDWWSEATHGISHVRDGPRSTTPFESNFALPITTACSFNRTLWQLTGRAIGREARAFMNAGNAYSTFWAPVVNLLRDPVGAMPGQRYANLFPFLPSLPSPHPASCVAVQRWGRNLETPGEDPMLSGEYATHFVRGMQEDPSDPTHLMASACCKHLVGNSVERSTG